MEERARRKLLGLLFRFGGATPHECVLHEDVDRENAVHVRDDAVIR
tara:strand:- start:43 stop:180 length:138 start_codon:yes stop_codon:yes gene_type:complete